MNAELARMQQVVAWAGEYLQHTLRQVRQDVAVSPRFIARELSRAVRHHAGTAAAVVVTATLSLVMFGGALLLHAQIDHLKGAWYDKTQVSAYLTPDATATQIADLGQMIKQDARVQQVWFEDHDLAYRNFARQFADSPDMVAEVTPAQMPQSYRIKLADPSNGRSLVSELSDQPGVRQVVDEHAQLATLFGVLNSFQRAALVLALIQAFAAVVLISNMVRSSILLRAEDLQVGRVMGATRTQLALPFLSEVALYGSVGTAGACALLALGKHELIDTHLASSGILSGIAGYVGWDALWQAVPWLLLAGVGMPVLVAGVALRRHLVR